MAPRILIAEYEPDDIARLLRVLEEAKLSFDSATAKTRNELSHRLAHFSPDIVLCGSRIADIGALEILTIAKEQRGDPPVIVVTEALGDERAAELVRAGAVDYVLKENLARLPAAVLDALEEGRERRRRLAAQQESYEYQRRLRRLFVHALNGIVVLDQEGRMLDANPAACTIIGRSSHELLGSVWNELLETDTSEAAGLLSHSTTVEPSDQRIAVIRQPDGRRISIELAHAVDRDASGKTLAYVIFHDVTDEMRLRRELRLLIENAPDQIVRVDRKQRYQFVSPSVERITGVRASQLLGKRIDAGLTPAPGLSGEAHARWMEAVENVLRNGRAENVQLEASSEGRKRSYLSRIVAEEDERGRILSALSFTREVSELMEMRESLERSEAQLKHAQRMESIGRLAGGVAHDFNNILTAILGNLQLARMGGATREKLERYLENIGQAAQRAARLTNQLLLFSRKAPSEITEVDLNATVEEITKMLTRLVGEDVRIAMVLDAELPRIQADMGKIEQVIMNLAVNARDAMPRGGEITIATRRIEGPPGGESAGSWVRLTVQDTGTGMNEEVKAQMFEPFFTTKDREKGTGLGLSVVYGIVEELGGVISVDSEPGKGTTFRIDFPRETATRLPGRDGESATPARGGEGAARVLLIEDDEGVREPTRESLEAAGMAVVGVARIDEAEEVVRKGEPFDVVLADVVLPDGSGADLPERLGGDLPFVFLSGYLDDREDLDRVRGLGHAFLQKPYSIELLVSTVRSAMKRVESQEAPRLEGPEKGGDGSSNGGGSDRPVRPRR